MLSPPHVLTTASSTTWAVRLADELEAVGGSGETVGGGDRRRHCVTASPFGSQGPTITDGQTSRRITDGCTCQSGVWDGAERPSFGVGVTSVLRGRGCGILRVSESLSGRGGAVFGFTSQSMCGLSTRVLLMYYTCFASDSACPAIPIVRIQVCLHVHSGAFFAHSLAHLRPVLSSHSRASSALPHLPLARCTRYTGRAHRPPHMTHATAASRAICASASPRASAVSLLSLLHEAGTSETAGQTVHTRYSGVVINRRVTLHRSAVSKSFEAGGVPVRQLAHVHITGHSACHSALSQRSHASPTQLCTHYAHSARAVRTVLTPIVPVRTAH